MEIVKCVAFLIPSCDHGLEVIISSPSTYWLICLCGLKKKFRKIGLPYSLIAQKHTYKQEMIAKRGISSFFFKPSSSATSNFTKWLAAADKVIQITITFNCPTCPFVVMTVPPWFLSSHVGDQPSTNLSLLPSVIAML